MKKMFAILLVLLVFLSACSKGVPQEDYDKLVRERDSLKAQLEELQEDGGKDEAAPTKDKENGNSVPAVSPAKSTPANGGEFDSAAIVEALEVEEYFFEGSYGGPSIFMLITNTSEYTLSISANYMVYGPNKALIGAKDANASTVPAGEIAFLEFRFDEKFSSGNCEISVSEEKWNVPASQNLSFTSSKAKEKEIITVTNNGDISVHFVTADILFFKGEDVVEREYGYFTDPDGELKPGKSLTQEARCSEDYDKIVVVLSGYGMNR